MPCLLPLPGALLGSPAPVQYVQIDLRDFRICWCFKRDAKKAVLQTALAHAHALLQAAPGVAHAAASFYSTSTAGAPPAGMVAKQWLRPLCSYVPI